MAADSIYDDLPDDPERAFLLLEAHFRAKCDDQIREAGEMGRNDVFYVEYISKVLAAIEGLEISASFSMDIPRIEDVDYSTYLNFSKDVEHFKTLIQIRAARRSKGFVVRFDAATKLKLRHYIEKIKEVVDKLDVDQDKRDALYKKIEALSLQVDRDRTRLELYGDLVVASFGIAADSAERLEPLLKWLEPIGRLIWGAKQDEAAQLPRPGEPARIPGPQKPELPSTQTTEEDVPA